MCCANKPAATRPQHTLHRDEERWRRDPRRPSSAAKLSRHLAELGEAIVAVVTKRWRGRLLLFQLPRHQTDRYADPSRLSRPRAPHPQF